MGLIEWLTGWEKLEWGDTKGKPIPKWVEKAYWKWNNKFRNRPYGKIKYFYGKTFIYKVKCVADVQGGSYYWYRKLRN